MDNEEYVRRVVKLKQRILQMFPDPPGDWDSNSDWKWVMRRRARAEARIIELPKRWRTLHGN